MSTRAVVYVHWVQYGDVKLYHHCDGYVSWLGNRIVSTMIQNWGENVVPTLFQIWGFEVDEVNLMHWDVEYVYDIYVKHWTVEFQGKNQTITNWRVEVREGYDERSILKQKGIEIGSGWSMSNYERRWDDEKIEQELKLLEDKEEEEDVVESIDTDSDFYNAYYS